MNFKGWQRTSLIEYPGKIATVVFTGGCNFRCPFCYNADLVLKPESLPDLPEATLLEFLEKNRRLYQALVISGGEPTLQEGLAGFLAGVKRLGLSTGLETNGTNPHVLRELLHRRLVDFIALDVKAPLKWSAYRRAAGIGAQKRSLFERVRQSLSLLEKAPVEVELRCTAVPELHSPEDLRLLGRQLRGHRRFVVQQLVPENALDPHWRAVKPFEPEILLKIRKEIAPNLASCEVRGI